jgi:cytochrome P450
LPVPPPSGRITVVGERELFGEAVTARNPAFRDDPHPSYDRLRARGPTLDPEYHRLLVTDHATARKVLRHKGFGVDARRATEGSYMRSVAGTGVLEGRGDNAYEPPLVLLDDPAHRRVRLLVSQAFNAGGSTGRVPGSSASPTN